MIELRNKDSIKKKVFIDLYTNGVDGVKEWI